METKIPDISDARKFSEGVRRPFPHQMLAYNLSPSFNWDASGMNDNDIATFNDDLGKLGYVSVLIFIHGIITIKYHLTAKHCKYIGLAVYYTCRVSFKWLDCDTAC